MQCYGGYRVMNCEWLPMSKANIVEGRAQLILSSIF